MRFLNPGWTVAQLRTDNTILRQALQDAQLQISAASNTTSRRVKTSDRGGIIEKENEDLRQPIEVVKPFAARSAADRFAEGEKTRHHTYDRVKTEGTAQTANQDSRQQECDRVEILGGVGRGYVSHDQDSYK